MRYLSAGSIGKLLRIEGISIGAVAYFDGRLSKESPFRENLIAVIGRSCASLLYFERYPRRYVKRGSNLKRKILQVEAPGWFFVEWVAPKTYTGRSALDSRSVRVRNVRSLYNGVVVPSRNLPSLLFRLKRATIPRYSTLFSSIPRRPTLPSLA